MAKYDLGSAASGALSGAATGAAVGSAIPGIGTAIGAGVGGLVGGAAGFFGSKKKKRKLSTLDKRQQEIYSKYAAGLQGQGPLAGLFQFDAAGANNAFDQNVARPAYRGFQENIIPSITGQFRSNNLQNSSYAGQALSRAGRDVQEGLDAQRAAFQFQGQQGAQQRQFEGINNILGQSNFAYERGQGGIDDILRTLAPEAGKYLADALKGYTGTSPTTPASPTV